MGMMTEKERVQTRDCLLLSYLHYWQDHHVDDLLDVLAMDIACAGRGEDSTGAITQAARYLSLQYLCNPAFSEAALRPVLSSKVALIGSNLQTLQGSEQHR